MYKKWNIGRFQFFVGCQRLQWIDGVSSFVEDGRHILMWDFDELPAYEATSSLALVQHIYELPPIYLLESSAGCNWIAYCFKRLDWRVAFVIVASTPNIDWRFVQHSLVRGYFTLRISKKHGVEPKLYCRLPSNVEEDCSVDSLARFVKYQTKAD